MFLSVDYLIMVVNLYSVFSICIFECALQGIDMNEMRPDHNTGNSMSYSLRIVWGFFYVPLVLV